MGILEEVSKTSVLEILLMYDKIEAVIISRRVEDVSIARGNGQPLYNFLGE